MKNLWANGTWGSGRTRWFYRCKIGGRVHRWQLPDADPETIEFLDAYARARKRHLGDAPARRDPVTGTIAAGCHAYLASDRYLRLARSTRELWRREVEAIESDYGAGLLTTLLPRHIRQDMADRSPHAANRRRKVWRSLGRFWEETGLIDENPARHVAARETPRTDGHRAWTADDVARFRAHWPHDSAQRLAFEVMFRSCAAIGDACRLGPANVRDGWLTYQRGKSGSEATAPMRADLAPDWFGWTDDLERCLIHAPRHAVWITTTHGAARSQKAAAQWFSAAARRAGLDGLTAHGVRKHRAAAFKEAGATPEQRMAILGHETEAMAQRYSKSADLRRIISGTSGDTKRNQGDTKHKKPAGKSAG